MTYTLLTSVWAEVAQATQLTHNQRKHPMIKFFLLLVLAFGAFMGLAMFFPTSTHTAFHAMGHSIPYIAIGVCLVGYVGYKAIK